MMGQDRLAIANDIIDEIIKDLRDRRGFRHLLESIEMEDPDTYKDIHDTLAHITATILNDYDVR